MAPPPLPTGAAAQPSTLHSVEELAAFGDALADFLDQWNSILAGADGLLAAFSPLADPGESAAKPNPVAKHQPELLLAKWNSVLVGCVPVAGRVAESSGKPSPVATVPVDASSTATGTVPVAGRVAESSTKPCNVATLSVDAASTGPGTVPVAVGAESNAKPSLVATVHVDAASTTTGTVLVAGRVAESSAKPSPMATAPVDVASAAAQLPVADPVLESNTKPSLPIGAPELAPTAPQPEPKPVSDRERSPGEPSAAVLRHTCKQMGSRALRRFVTAHLRNRSWLRRVGPGALQRAPDPAALVLYAVSRYYICCESENAEAACLLLLELYVRAGCPCRQGQGEDELRVEAREAVLSWRSRIVRERGQVADASVRDARGLILLMAAFGVPTEFPLQELYELLFAAGGLACADVLNCSKLFVKKMRDVVADMLNKGNYHEAIGVILAFKLQGAFSLSSILTYIVEKVVHIRQDQERSEGQSNKAGSEERDKEELVLLRSISTYVEEHTSCSSEKISPCIAERIKLLERVEQPKQAFKATKQKRRSEDILE